MRAFILTSRFVLAFIAIVMFCCNIIAGICFVAAFAYLIYQTRPDKYRTKEAFLGVRFLVMFALSIAISLVTGWFLLSLPLGIMFTGAFMKLPPKHTEQYNSVTVYPDVYDETTGEYRPQ